MRAYKYLPLISAVMIAVPAHANEAINDDAEQQEQASRTTSFPDTPSSRPEDAGNKDFLLVGIGAGFRADYSGADSYDFTPTPLVIGRYKGIDFATRGPGITVDVIRDKKDAKVNYLLGPLIRFRFDRNDVDNIDDAQVAALDELDTAVELGVSAGIKVNKIFSAYDDITFLVDTQWDVAGAHSGMVVSPSVNYSTPLSEGIVVRLSSGITYVSEDFVDTYSSIDAANSLASGLDQFDAGDGIRDVSGTMLLAIDLDGDVRNGGWGVFGLGSYSRLVGDSGRSPIVRDTGSRNQFFGAIGIGYSF